MNDKIKDALKEIQKKHKTSTIVTGDSDDLKFDRIPIGITLLDDLIGGGFPTRRFTLLAGHYGSCKTFISLQIVKAMQEKGLTAAYIDGERSYDEAWFKTLGIDTESLIVAQPENGEKAFDIIIALLDAGINLIIIDSLKSLNPGVVEEASMEQNTMAQQARMLNKGILKTIPHIGKDSMVIAINHMIANIGGYGSPESVPGGTQQHYMASVELHLFSSSKIEETDSSKDRKYKGFKVRIYQKKNKVGGQEDKEIFIPFMFDGYLDNIAGIIEVAKALGIITNKGASYTMFEEKYFGQEKLKTALLEDDALFNRLRKEIETGDIGNAANISAPEDESTDF